MCNTKGQIVAKRKGAEDKSSDSLRTLQLMQAIAENTERLTNDSLHTIAQDNENNTTDIDIVQQSIQREEEHVTAMGEKMQAQSAHLLATPAIAKPTSAGTPKLSVVLIKKTGTSATTPRVIVTKPVIKTTIKPTTKPIIKITPGNAAKPKAVMPKPISKPVIKKAGNEY